MDYAIETNADDDATSSNKTSFELSNDSLSDQIGASDPRSDILRQCFQLYNEKQHGILAISKDIKEELNKPRKKITIMLIGNHSAGKSSFINWYIGEHILKTGVAIETQGFTIVTCGRRRETLGGRATFKLFPQLEPLNSISGIGDHISTEVSTSRYNKFPSVNFIDTPGLVDGEMHYPYDVNRALIWLGAEADLIFVFFDPMGQALCKRTMNLVEKLNERYTTKMKFFLSKADEAGSETDRQKVLMQIVQELCKKPQLNKTGFEMPTIYVPIKGKNERSRCPNQIKQVCKEIEKTIDMSTQKTLNQMKVDSDMLNQKLEYIIRKDNYKCDKNYSLNVKSMVTAFMGWITINYIIIFALLGYKKTLTRILHEYVDEDPRQMLINIMDSLDMGCEMIPVGERSTVYFGLIGLTMTLFIVSFKFRGYTRSTLPKPLKRKYVQHKKYLDEVVAPTQAKLYGDYLEQAVLND